MLRLFRVLPGVIAWIPGLLAVSALAAMPVAAAIPEPDIVYYGAAKVNGIPVSAGGQVSVRSGSEVLASYTIGDLPAANLLYVLRVPLVQLEVGESRPSGRATVGLTATLFVNGVQGPEIAIPERGSILHLDVDADGSGGSTTTTITVTTTTGTSLSTTTSSLVTTTSNSATTTVPTTVPTTTSTSTTLPLITVTVGDGSALGASEFCVTIDVTNTNGKRIKTISAAVSDDPHEFALSRMTCESDAPSFSCVADTEDATDRITFTISDPGGACLSASAQLHVAELCLGDARTPCTPGETVQLRLESLTVTDCDGSPLSAAAVAGNVTCGMPATTSTTSPAPLCTTESCDDGDACTVDTCDPSAGCRYRAITQADVTQTAPDVTTLCTERIPRSIKGKATTARRFLEQAKTSTAAGKTKKALKLTRKALRKIAAAQRAVERSKKLSGDCKAALGHAFGQMQSGTACLVGAGG